MMTLAHTIGIDNLGKVLDTLARAYDWDDDWASIGDTLDLNLWTGPDEEHMATLYPVENGFTRTSNPILTIAMGK